MADDLGERCLEALCLFGGKRVANQLRHGLRRLAPPQRGEQFRYDIGIRDRRKSNFVSTGGEVVCRTYVPGMLIK
ncbi:MAG: hypothetical protein BGN95_11425 [Sphingomonas sp. 66-10]|uniref:hypothetical protein n=1 Tax=Sphingomonas sp. 66-10 TaxID=1895848 RepID=UPI00092A1C78|nr:hypothetical protein [Sphingomonas sp. 66-10]OJU21226.1 MAG: hypothetical protein BGN95_11425 [Sphingomonas sp. 66-10]